MKLVYIDGLTFYKLHSFYQILTKQNGTVWGFLMLVGIFCKSDLDYLKSAW